MDDHAHTKSLHEVINREKDYIKQRRQQALKELGCKPQSDGHFDSNSNIIGLALSGGGMRSATFNLGLVQGLAKIGFLPWVDYLSTVSGGGYLGCCLSSLLSMRYITVPAGTEIWSTLNMCLWKNVAEAKILDKEWLYISYGPKEEGWIKTEDSAEIEKSDGLFKPCYIWPQSKDEGEVKYLPLGFVLNHIIERWFNIRYKKDSTKTFSEEGWIQGIPSFPLPKDTKIWRTPDDSNGGKRPADIWENVAEAEILNKEWLYISYGREGWINTKNAAKIEKLRSSTKSCYIWPQPKDEGEAEYLRDGFVLNNVIDRWFNIRYKRDPATKSFEEGWIRVIPSCPLPSDNRIWRTLDELHILKDTIEAEILGNEWLYISYWAHDQTSGTGSPLKGWINTEDAAEIEKSGGASKPCYVWSQPEVETEVKYLPCGFKLEGRPIEHWFKIRYKKDPDAENFSEGWVQSFKPKIPLTYKFDMNNNFPFAVDRLPFHMKTTSPFDQIGRNHQLYHMRLNSNFIIPRRGLFKLDTLRGVGTVLTGVSHTLAIFGLMFFIIAGLHYVLAGALAPEIGQKIEFVRAPTLPTETSLNPEPLIVETPDEQVALDLSLNAQITPTITFTESHAYDVEHRSITLDRFWHILFLSEPPTQISPNGELITTSPSLPIAYWWFLGIGLLLPFIIFFYLNHAYKHLQPTEKSEDNISAQERSTIQILRTGLLVLLLVFVLVTLILRNYAVPPSTFRLYWLWQPAVFMGGVWLTSTFVYMLYAQYKFWNADFRSLISGWQADVSYGLLASLLFAILALPYYIILPNAQNQGSNVTILLITSLLSTAGSYLLANNLANAGGNGQLKKFFSRLEGLQKGVLAVLTFILILSFILLYATLFDSIPHEVSALVNNARPWLNLLFALTILSLILYMSVWLWNAFTATRWPYLLILILLLIIFWQEWNILPPTLRYIILISVVIVFIVALISSLMRGRLGHSIDWPKIEAWLLQTFTIFGILMLFSLILWFFLGGIYVYEINWISPLTFVLSSIAGLGLLAWSVILLVTTCQGLIQPHLPKKVAKFLEKINSVTGWSAVILALGLVVFVLAWGLGFSPIADLRWLTVWLITLLSIGLFMLINWFTNLNQLSLHYFYRDRLAAAFLKTNIYDNAEGKIIPVRDQSETKVQDINPPHCSAPYHLIVTALNLSGSHSLSYRDSKSEPFIFSRYFCGSNNTGYSETSIYRGGETKLARALAISGAAFSSALGQYTFFAQAFIMTMLNFRLGYWMDNPRIHNPKALYEANGSNQFIRLNRNNPYTLEPTIFWAKYLWHELSGTADSSKKLINLSDGGHTDNLGLYPLLQRRCKLIIVSDAGGDAEYMFDDITRLIRRVSIEENIKIEINLDGLRPDSDNHLSRCHCAVGEITYPDTQEANWLIYFKPSITAEVEGAVKAYWWMHQDDHFPHQSTLDQFYDDDQFEAYRQLGEQTISNTLGSWRAFYDQRHEDHSKQKTFQGVSTTFDRITTWLAKVSQQDETLKKPLDNFERAKLMRSILKDPDKKLLLELSNKLSLKDVVCDLRDVTIDKKQV